MLDVLPSNLPGITWDVTKTTITSTNVKTARSGKEYRAANWSFGKYKWHLQYSCLRQNRNGFQELQQLFGFCETQQGMFQNFLYSDPTDNTVLGQGLGIGDGVITQFQLVRAFGGFVNPNLVVNNLMNVYLNGVLQTTGFSAVQIGAFGLDTLQFSSAPGSGVVITADFSYYFPVRFLQDDPEFANFAFQFWSLKQLEFQSVK